MSLTEKRLKLLKLEPISTDWSRLIVSDFPGERYWNRWRRYLEEESISVLRPSHSLQCWNAMRRALMEERAMDHVWSSTWREMIKWSYTDFWIFIESFFFPSEIKHFQLIHQQYLAAGFTSESKLTWNDFGEIMTAAERLKNTATTKPASKQDWLNQIQQKARTLLNEQNSKTP